MPDSDVTLGEVFRRLVSMERAVESNVDRLRDRIESLQFVHRDVYSAEMSTLRARIDELEDDKRWTRRAQLTSLILPIVVGLLLAALTLRI